MAFLTVKPPVNAQFAEAYNAIVEGCWKRGFGIDLKKKKIGGFDGKNRKEHEITSEDMQQLRDIIQKGKDQFFDRSKLNLSLPDPFSDAEAKPEINGGKGFLLMPGDYTESGESIYSKEGSASGSLPVLWEHFTDLKAVLESLTTRKYDYSVHIAMNSTDMDVQVDFNRGELSATAPAGAPRTTGTLNTISFLNPTAKGSATFYSISGPPPRKGLRRGNSRTER